MIETLRNPARVWHVLAASLTLLTVTACSLDSLLKSNEVPPDIRDPAITQTRVGALTAYAGTIVRFQAAFGGGTGFRQNVVALSGLLADELLDGDMGSPPASSADLRMLSTALPEPFSGLQAVRGQAGQAIGLLTLYAPDQRALIGHTYALEGYAEVLLAEVFCSGVPLSTLDFGGDYTLKPGSTTSDILIHAAALFDTALTLAGDSARFVQMAAVGKARALLGLGQYATAAATVAGVPDAFRYQVAYSAATGADAKNFLSDVFLSSGLWGYSVANREGDNGLDYIGSGDPRTASVLQGTNPKGYSVYRPQNYATDGSSSITLASGVEARLIEAEAALQGNDVAGWLDKLNQLRRTGITPGLADTTDPGTVDARVDLLFRERAFWLFLTGHRQGDLRRLIRQYGRTQDEVFPVGPYPAAPYSYGSDVTVPVPEAEQTLNPLYSGCFSRNA